MADIIRRPNGTIIKRAVREAGWTRAKRRVFLDVLATTCNVSEACRQVGMQRCHVIALRARDGVFAQLYEAAMALGRERLEEELLARALGQVDSGDNPSDERGEPAPIPFDKDLAFRVLALRDGTPGRSGRKLAPAVTQEQVDAALMKQLDALARRQSRS